MCLNKVHDVEIPADNIGYQVLKTDCGELRSLFFFYSPESSIILPLSIGVWETSRVFKKLAPFNPSLPTYPKGFHIHTSLDNAFYYQKWIGRYDTEIYKVKFADILATGIERFSYPSVQEIPVIVCNFRLILHKVRTDGVWKGN